MRRDLRDQEGSLNFNSKTIHHQRIALSVPGRLTKPQLYPHHSFTFVRIAIFETKFLVKLNGEEV
jgi:hypothetical protein